MEGTNNCVICDARGAQLMGKDLFDPGLKLLCKLINCADNSEEFGGKRDGGGGGVDGGGGGVDGGDDGGGVEVCELCRDALKDTVKLKELMEDAKATQRKRVNFLKKAVLRLKSTETQDNLEGGGYWGFARRQLVTSCSRQARKSTRKRRAVTDAAEALPSSSTGENGKVDLPPCMVALALRRINLDDYKSRGGHYLLKTSVQANQEDEDGFYFEPEVILLEGPGEVTLPPDSLGEPGEPEPKHCVRQHRTSSRKPARLITLSKHVFMFQCTVIQFIPELHGFVCQEPYCGAVILGSFLDGSLFTAISDHVQTQHSDTFTAEGHRRTCPFCLDTCSGPPKAFRKHLTSTHCPTLHVVCEICGKGNVLSEDRLHKWGHKNFSEKAAALKSGDCPATILKKIEKRGEKDPLYAVVCELKENVDPEPELDAVSSDSSFVGTPTGQIVGRGRPRRRRNPILALPAR